MNNRALLLALSIYLCIADHNQNLLRGKGRVRGLISIVLKRRARRYQKSIKAASPKQHKNLPKPSTKLFTSIVRTQLVIYEKNLWLKTNI